MVAVVPKMNLYFPTLFFSRLSKNGTTVEREVVLNHLAFAFFAKRREREREGEGGRERERERERERVEWNRVRVGWTWPG